jgi:gliding motility-associated-like protein
MSFTHSDSLCIADGLFDFDATVSGPSNTIYQWNFGPLSVPNQSSAIDVNNVQFFTPGNHPVFLVGSYDVCSDTVYSNVFVYAEPTINFMYVNSLQCAPSTAYFVNLSTSDTPPIYQWDFGDGGSSNLFSPSHVYYNVGSYSVGLTMITTSGCIDTLYMLQQDLVVVNPSPVAGFIVSPNKVDICNAEVRFINQSSGATDYFYFFDQNTFTSTESDFIHTYINTGSDYPLQVVTNEFGCSDSARSSIFVEPFSLYIPNAFIPDGDEVNDNFKPISDFEILEWDFQIYNRWGELVFQTAEFGQAWDGTIDGRICQDGLYAYVLTYRSCANPHNPEKITGHVSLLR